MTVLGGARPRRGSSILGPQTRPHPSFLYFHPNICHLCVRTYLRFPLFGFLVEFYKV